MVEIVDRLYWWSCPRCQEENKIAWEKCFKCGKNQIEQKQKTRQINKKEELWIKRKEKDKVGKSLLNDSAQIIKQVKQSK